MCETLRYWQMSDTLILKKEGGSGTGWGCGGGGGGGGCRGEGGGGRVACIRVGAFINLLGLIR